MEEVSFNNLEDIDVRMKCLLLVIVLMIHLIGSDLIKQQLLRKKCKWLAEYMYIHVYVPSFNQGYFKAFQYQLII